MDKLEKWLRARPLAISLVLALVVSYCLATNGVVSEDIMPFSDGEHYILRGLTLYGYLHSGQWSQFWDAFTMPRQALAPLHYWIFFLLPQSLASVTSYGVIQVVTTNVVLALGTWALCRALDRVEWTPALFLLCANQNISIDQSYFFHMDGPFFASGTLALAWQVGAWRDFSWRNSLLAGAGLGLMFWIKPANAVIFAAVFLFTEIVRAGLTWFVGKRDGSMTSEAASKWRRDLLRHASAMAAGFIPVAFLAMACGGIQSIAKLVNANEASGALATTLECTGLFRLLYFPLCLTIFYHAVAMLLIFTVAGIAAYKMRQKNASPSAAPGPLFPAHLLLPLIIAYAVLGEVFSFAMADKEMRSLLLVLPVLWLAVFWGLDRWRARPGLLLGAAVAYVVCAYSQIFCNTFETVDVPTEGYQLKGDWLGRLPQAHVNYPAQIGLTTGLLGLIHQAMPDGGKVAVGSEQLYLTAESLSWASQHELALQGRQSPYQFQNFLKADGRYCRSALLGAKGILVFVNPGLQYSQQVAAISNALVQFSAATWLKSGAVQMVPVQQQGGALLGCLVVAREPLDDARITQLVQGTGGAELSPAEDVTFNWQDNHRLTWQDCEDILQRWKQKRLGGE